MLHRLRKIWAAPETPPRAAPVFSAPEGVRIYAVGDIHGRSRLLKKMMEAIARDAAGKPPATIIEIYLGDYIDRGMHSREVIDLLLAPPPAGHERRCLLGNHEDALLRFLKDPKFLRSWGNFGGYATLASYGIPIPESMSPENLAMLRARLLQNMPPEHLQFLRELPLRSLVGDYLFVHAGIEPGVALEAQKRDNLLWIRNPFLNYEGFFDHYVVHGHSPLDVPEVKENRANLDVSAAPTSSLCCLVLENTTRNLILVTDENH